MNESEAPRYLTFKGQSDARRGVNELKNNCKRKINGRRDKIHNKQNNCGHIMNGGFVIVFKRSLTHSLTYFLSLSLTLTHSFSGIGKMNGPGWHCYGNANIKRPSRAVIRLCQQLAVALGTLRLSGRKYIHQEPYKHSIQTRIIYRFLNV